MSASRQSIDAILGMERNGNRDDRMEGLSQRLIQAYTGLREAQRGPECSRTGGKDAIHSDIGRSGRCPPRSSTMKRGASGAPIRHRQKMSPLQEISEELVAELEQPDRG